MAAGTRKGAEVYVVNALYRWGEASGQLWSLEQSLSTDCLLT